MPKTSGALRVVVGNFHLVLLLIGTGEQHLANTSDTQGEGSSVCELFCCCCCCCCCDGSNVFGCQRGPVCRYECVWLSAWPCLSVRMCLAVTVALSVVRLLTS